MKLKPLIIDSSKSNFRNNFLKRIRINDKTNSKIQNQVNKIIDNVKANGDISLVDYVTKFDGYKLNNIKNIFVTKNEIKKAYSYVSKEQIISLKKSIKRIREFAKKQLSKSWSISKDGSVLGEKITPIESVGVYVPAGKASYPSTVLMNTIPARVAGVKKIIMISPINSIEDHALAIVAADLCKVDQIMRMGGAHAIAALTYGTKNIPTVDKIVGPGNIYVTLAKKKCIWRSWHR